MSRTDRLWLWYGVYLFILGFLAFGQHDEATERALWSVGLRSGRFVWTFGDSQGTTVPAFRGVGFWQANAYLPNYGGFVAYAVAGAAVAYALRNISARSVVPEQRVQTASTPASGAESRPTAPPQQEAAKPLPSERGFERWWFSKPAWARLVLLAAVPGLALAVAAQSSVLAILSIIALMVALVVEGPHAQPAGTKPPAPGGPSESSQHLTARAPEGDAPQT
ncbi:hypothetical protein caldi_26240 [Caldinitratiruptor microaerophilus]|uniref:Uncharacterized protein n=1 Tax=Caldinitratiruptor microaerophilus TaxID=671077 RepID=A0AA35GAP9_9FIRM|nr:hypothetical protein caldi_26240 [Caldinitratiruptor microaerophilus]